MFKQILFFLLLPVLSYASGNRTGSLESYYMHTIAHFRGNPYEIGYQHGSLLRDKVHKNLERFVSDAATARIPDQERLQAFCKEIPNMMQYIPPALLMEMMGVADGAQVPFQKILMLNLFPEMFHCAGIVLGANTTRNGRLLHARVLDYGFKNQLEDTAVIMVVRPDDGYPFVNVSYAGFVGTVTGMNMQKISIGEIGGQGYGDWDGIPMALLLRQVLQYSRSIDEATSILTLFKRTCEYYYVVADGKTNQSLGYYATPQQLQTIHPGSNYAIFAPNNVKDNKKDKYIHSDFTITTTSHQTVFYDAKKQLIALAHQQPSDCLILTGFSKPERFQLMTDRILERIGDIRLLDLVLAMKAPFASSDNLHNVIFSPATLEFWVAHAGDGLPACDQNYINYHLDTLVEK